MGGQELPGDEPGAVKTSVLLLSFALTRLTLGLTAEPMGGVTIRSTQLTHGRTEKPTPCLQLWNLGFLVQDNNTM